MMCKIYMDHEINVGRFTARLQTENMLTDHYLLPCKHQKLLLHENFYFQSAG